MGLGNLSAHPSALVEVWGAKRRAQNLGEQIGWRSWEGDGWPRWVVGAPGGDGAGVTLRVRGSYREMAEAGSPRLPGDETWLMV